MGVAFQDVRLRKSCTWKLDSSLRPPSPAVVEQRCVWSEIPTQATGNHCSVCRPEKSKEDMSARSTAILLQPDRGKQPGSTGTVGIRKFSSRASSFGWEPSTAKALETCQGASAATALPLSVGSAAHLLSVGSAAQPLLLEQRLCRGCCAGHGRSTKTARAVPACLVVDQVPSDQAVVEFARRDR